MNKHIRYTCAKKEHPVLKADCEKCSEYIPCAKEGKWCFVGALVAEHEPNLSESAAVEFAGSSAAPMPKEQSAVTIYFGNKTSADVSKEGFDAQFKKALLASLNRSFLGGYSKP